MNNRRAVTGHSRWQVLIIIAGLGILATLLAYVALTFTSQMRPATGGT